ncbi:MAG: molybdate ABC transporter substrate-binding protein [Eggerthellaceae bacterium]|jgi:molybdate transport system substrate-binding protein
MSRPLTKNRRKPWAIGALLAAALCACLVLAGCGSSGSQEDSSNSQSASQEAPKTSISILCDTQMEGPLSELEQLYASEHDDVEFTLSSEQTDKTLLKALSDNAKSVKSSGQDSQSTGADDADSAISLVFGLSDSATKQAVKNKLLKRDSQTDVVADSLVIVAGKNGKADSVTVNQLVSGKWLLALANGSSSLGKLQTQALSALGACTPQGQFTGALAKSGKVKRQGMESQVFAALSKSKRAVSVVKKSDVYRYGGVKIVGEIPANAYTAPRYSASATTAASDDQASAAQDFLNWCVTDADAIEIWEKWGFTLAA